MFNNILVPTDGSDSSQHAVRMAVQLAKTHQARITGIHVIPDYHLLIAYEGAFDPVTEERIEEEARSHADVKICPLEAFEIRGVILAAPMRDRLEGRAALQREQGDPAVGAQ